MNLRIPTSFLRKFGVITLAVATGFVSACKQRVAQDVPVPATGRMLDTARGVIRRVGNDPVSVLVLTSGSDANANVVALAGPSLLTLERAAGLEVSIAGLLTAERNMMASPRGAPVFEVRHFIVRAADGQPAVDGVLNSQNGEYFLISANGVRHNTPNLPAALRAQIGARIFLVGPLDRAPAAFGILAEK